MIAATLSVSQPAHLSLRRGQVQLFLKESEREEMVPMDGLGYLILDHPQITMSQALLAKLGENQVATVVCDGKHLPLTLALPLHGHHLSQEKFHHQLNAPLPLKKRLWKRIITAKIANQGLVLKEKGAVRTALLLQHYKKQVMSGDTTQQEAQAARKYWPALLGKRFIREPKREDSYNLALNYGYAILRATVARALIGSGLLPFAGVHHHNRYNPYCLADDIMEPYRPWVDHYLLTLTSAFRPSPTILTREERNHLLEIPYLACQTARGKGQLHSAIAQTTASLAKAYEEGEASLITFAKLPFHGKKGDMHPSKEDKP